MQSLREPSAHFALTPLAALVAASALLAGCGDDEPPTSSPADTGVGLDAPPPLPKLLGRANEQGLSAFVQAVESAGLTSLLEGEGPFTVFAPSDGALSSASLPSDPELLANLLLDHVLPYEADSAAVLEASSLRNAANRRLSVDPAGPNVGGAPLSTTDVFASNGVLHVMDGVIQAPTAAEFVSGDPRTATLASAVDAASASIRETLGGSGPITVFAPVDAAFEDVDVDVLLADGAYLDLTLGFHVVEGHYTEADLASLGGSSLTTASGQDVGIRILTGGQLVLADSRNRTARIEVGNIRLSNAVVHLVDTVLIPDRGEVDLLETLRRNNFNSLAMSAMQSGLTGALQGPEPLTVFAPTDAAFAAASDALPTDPDLVANVLLTHTASTTLPTARLALLPSVQSVAGTSHLLDFAADPETIGAASFTRTLDVRASNGIVHGIDRVLLPPRIADVTRTNDALSTLQAAVEAASEDIGTALAGPGPITVFAPIDAAFQGIDVPTLVGDQARLDDLLRYHVAEGQALSTEFEDGQQLTMSNGATLTVRIDDEGVRLDDGTGTVIRVIRADLRLRNGVVHLIDGVLSPSHLAERARAAGLNALLSAAAAAGLSDALLSGGPFTVFGPTDAAFERLDFEPLDPFAVETVLLTHLVPGRLTSSDVLAAADLTAVSKVVLPVGTSTSGPTLGGAVLGPVLDVEASNGVLHSVESVILPPTVIELVVADPQLGSTETAVLRAPVELLDQLGPDVITGARPITVLAPTDAAWAAAGVDPSTADPAALLARLRHHIVTQPLSSDRLAPTNRVATYNQNLIIRQDGTGAITVEDANRNVANVLEADIRGLDGTVWLIDRVLEPR